MTSFSSQKAFHPRQNRFLRRGAFSLDLQAQQAHLKDKLVELPPCTFDYLVTLLRHSPDPVSYQKLVADSQGYKLSRIDAQDLVRLRIYMLRKAIEEDSQAPRYIVAVPGYGYRLLA